VSNAHKFWIYFLFETEKFDATDHNTKIITRKVKYSIIRKLMNKEYEYILMISSSGSMKKNLLQLVKKRRFTIFFFLDSALLK